MKICVVSLSLVQFVPDGVDSPSEDEYGRKEKGQEMVPILMVLMKVRMKYNGEVKMDRTR